MKYPRHLCAIRLSVAILMLISASPARAVEYPTGIYVSAGPTNSFSSSVVEAYADRPYIDGVLVRITWQDIETAPGVYDWTLLDEQFELAGDLGLQIALAVVNGKSAPEWLADRGVAYATYDNRAGGVDSMPLPWDPTYLTHWTGFIQALGERYNDNEILSLVHITNSSFNGFEMQLPSRLDNGLSWDDVGYTTALHVGSLETVVDAFADAFPDQPIDLEVHPVLNSDAVAEQIIAYANANIGDPFGVFAAWWSEHNADDIYPGMYELLKDQAAETFSTVQIVQSATTNPDAFGDGGFEGTLSRAFDDGVRYFEVWHNDVLNEELAPILSSLHDRLIPEPAHTMALGGLTLLLRRRRV